MSLVWTHEDSPVWDEDKARIVGGAEPGVFDPRFQELLPGDLVPGEWWHAEEDGRIVGYGWMDVVWGDAEILLAVAPDARGRGAGAFILERLEQEARARGLNRVYNTVRPEHPRAEAVTRWLVGHGFVPSEDGGLQKDVHAT